jgi:YidC/Oxa1 family membrane protein insertase
MEQSRLVIAIALSFLVFLLWHFLAPKPIEKKPEQESQATQKTVVREEPYVKEKGAEISEEESIVAKEVKPPPKVIREIDVETPLYTVKLSAKGAVVQSFVLKDYSEQVNQGSPRKELVLQKDGGETVLLGFEGKAPFELKDAVFSINTSSDAVDVLQKAYEIRFSWTSDQGIVVEKNYIFSPDTYLIGLHVTVKNGSNDAFQEQLVLTLTKSFSEDKTIYGFEGPSALIDNKLVQIKLKKIKDQNIFSGEIKWIAAQDRYFLSSFIPKKVTDASMRLNLNKNNLLEAQYLQPESMVKPGTQQTFEYQLFFGPKSTRVLSKYDNDLDKVINFGWFDILAKPCLWIMNFLHDHLIPNYGVAIIILTLITKILLWPLGTKSYKSMNQMKKLQPLIKEIREKYKTDKKKLNEETMALYRTYKINPLGGCLPMVVQIPVFFALYRMLYEAIELRHAPFFLWINDLSAPDRLLRFDFSIPFMQPPYGIPVLTLIMGASMLLQQKMSPPMGDPTQAKMMMFMPIVFTFIFINFSSGLVLYWLVNNIVSILQQQYISKKYAK